MNNTKDMGELVFCPKCSTTISVLNDFGSWKFYCSKCNKSSIYYDKSLCPDLFKQGDVKWEIIEYEELEKQKI